MRLFFPVAVRTCLLICGIYYRTKRWSDIKLHPSFALRIPISMSAPVLTDRNIGSLIKRFVSYASHEKKIVLDSVVGSCASHFCSAQAQADVSGYARSLPAYDREWYLLAARSPHSFITSAIASSASELEYQLCLWVSWTSTVSSPCCNTKVGHWWNISIKCSWLNCKQAWIRLCNSFLFFFF